LKSIRQPGERCRYLASIGIYVFPTDLPIEVLQARGDDFGNNIIPNLLGNFRGNGLCIMMAIRRTSERFGAFTKSTLK
jgi:hypothetical protein